MVSLYVRNNRRNDGTNRKTYCVEFKDISNRRKIKQFRLRKDAARFLTNLENHEKSGLMGVPISCKDLTQQWLESCKQGRNGNYPLEPQTISTYNSMVNNHILPYLGDMMWSDIDKDLCKKFRDHLVSKCQSRSTARSILTVFKLCMSFALEEGYVLSNLTKDITITVGGRHKPKEIVIPSKQVIKDLTATAEELSYSMPNVWIRYHPLLNILIYCGLRISEVTGLPRENVNFKDKSIKITQKCDKQGNIGPPKTKNSYRTVYFPDVVLVGLERYLSTHNYGLVFSSREGGPLLHRNVRRFMWQAILRRSDVSDHYKLHSLRHFYASIMIDRGCNVKELCKAMGHHDEGFTLKTYGHLFEDEESIRNRKLMANAIVV